MQILYSDLHRSPYRPGESPNGSGRQDEVLNETRVRTPKVLASSYGTFWCFAAAALLNLLFVDWFVPELKQTPLEEIEAYWRKGRTQA